MARLAFLVRQMWEMPNEIEPGGTEVFKYYVEADAKIYVPIAAYVTEIGYDNAVFCVDRDLSPGSTIRCVFTGKDFPEKKVLVGERRGR